MDLLPALCVIYASDQAWLAPCRMGTCGWRHALLQSTASMKTTASSSWRDEHRPPTIAAPHSHLRASLLEWSRDHD